MSKRIARTIVSIPLGAALLTVISQVRVAGPGAIATAHPTPVTLPSTGTIQTLTTGDRACFVELTDEDGQTQSHFARFELCEQDLVGERVSLSYEIANVMAASCGGDIECRETDIVPLITQAEVIGAPTQARISDLPDGNYRYWTGTPNGTILTQEELLEQGGILFTFRKQENRITGIFAHVDDVSICIQGRANGNTVTGVARQIPRSRSNAVEILSEDDTFVNFGPTGDLQVRRGELIAPQTVLYQSALLDLGDFNRINAGTLTAPTRCP